jgi:hypothetical protein
MQARVVFSQGFFLLKEKGSDLKHFHAKCI